MTFLFDENFPPVLPQALRLLGVDAWHLTEKFDRGISDEEWLPRCGARGWVVITGDRHIRSKHTEVRALQASGVVVFFACKASIHWRLKEKCFWIMRAWPRIEEEAQNARGGTWFEINSNGVPRRIPSP